MKLSKERKFFIFLLVFYWLGIFLATHIPIPGWTRRMGVSDKTMHFVAYLILTFLAWFSISFEQKANWKKLRPWLLSGIILFYGLADELLQHFAKRSVDIADFGANGLGLAAAMAVLTFLSGRHAIMILIAVCPFFLPAIVRSQLITAGSLLEGLGYLAGFAIVTIAWAKYLSLVHNLNFRQLKYMPLFFVWPAATVVILKLYTGFTNKPFGTTAVLIALSSIILTLFIWRLVTRENIV